MKEAGFDAQFGRSHRTMTTEELNRLILQGLVWHLSGLIKSMVGRGP